MALQANSRAPELVATIVNALAYHGLAVDPEEAARHVQNLVSNMPIDRDRSQRWLQEQIDRITAELGSLADAGHLTRRPLADTRALVSRRACHYVSRSAAPGSCRGRYHTDWQPGAALQNTAICPAGPHRPAPAPPGRAVAQHPRHRDQARSPLMSVLAALRVAPSRRTLHRHGMIRTCVRTPGLRELARRPEAGRECCPASGPAWGYGQP
jgi:hypothetical protein